MSHTNLKKIQQYIWMYFMLTHTCKVMTLFHYISFKYFTLFLQFCLILYFPEKKLNFTGKVGCAFCVIGSTVMIIHSPHELEVASMDELKEKIQETGICINNICITLSKKFSYLDILAFRN